MLSWLSQGPIHLLPFLDQHSLFPRAGLLPHPQVVCLVLHHLDQAMLYVPAHLQSLVVQAVSVMDIEPLLEVPSWGKRDFVAQTPPESAIPKFSAWNHVWLASGFRSS